YRSKHESIGDDPSKFVFSDDDYKDFKDFLVREKFEYKSFSEESVEDLIEVAKTEKYYDNISKDIETLLSKLKQDKDRDLERYRDEVTRWIVSYIMPRYFYEKGSIMFSINYDEEVKEAIKILKDEKRYNEILSPKK
ncbi:MAG: peptidase S41, partial [Bacteroidales bacterium]|nr:peptidase S41 [Bacteroidales bacterium]